MNKHTAISLLIAVFTSVFSPTYSQITVTTQLRTRAELRDGQGSPLSKNTKPAFFISQRSRMSALFTSRRLKTQLSLQDVRVWGQDVSTINRSTSQELNGLMLHEAWGEVSLSDTGLTDHSLSIKVGRQELVYDDQRLIGNLDWLQQARRHDGAIVKYETRKFKVHVGFAFNQNKENNAGTLYNSTPPGTYPATTNGGTMYKSIEYLWANHTLKQGNISFLFFADQFSRFSNDSINNAPTKVYKNGTWSRYTTGLHLEKKLGSIGTTASAYYQFGTNASGRSTSAYMTSLTLAYQTSRWTMLAGTDYTSGTSSAGRNRTFDPLYGTPHKFWGAMDYFYAGSGFGQGGLVDHYLRYKRPFNKKFTITTDLHLFRSATPVAQAGGRLLGQELDIISNYVVTPNISLEAGLAHFFAADGISAPSVKNISSPRSGANWAYLMLHIKPSFIFK